MIGHNTDLSTIEMRTERWLARIRDQELAMPDFQRDFVWRPKDVISLLVSVANRWPIGSLLVSDREAGSAIENLPLKEFDGLPKVDNRGVKLVVLDGQQRLTSLLQALHHDLSEMVYYVRGVSGLLERGPHRGFVLSEEDFGALSKEKFTKEFNRLEDRVRADVALIQEVSTSDQFQNWLDHLPMANEPGQRGKLGEARRQVFGDILEYRIPALMLDSGLGLEPLAAIFETVNKTGVQLGIEDLMLAKLYRVFNLKTSWDDAVDSAPLLADFADTWDGRTERGRKPVGPILILRLISLIESDAIKKGDILGLEAEQVKRRWDEAVNYTVEALKFLKTECGVAHHNLLPDEAIVLPVADHVRSTNYQVDNSLLGRWYWRSVVDETYKSGTSTQPVADAIALRKGRLPASFSGEEHGRENATRILEGKLIEQVGRHKELACGIAGLVVRKGGSDWQKRTSLADLGEDIELHHIFPMRFSINNNWKRSSNANPANIVSNLTPLSASTNKSIGSKPLSTLVEDPSRFSPSYITDHMIPDDAFAVGNDQTKFEEFARIRASRLAAGLMERCY